MCQYKIVRYYLNCAIYYVKLLAYKEQKMKLLAHKEQKMMHNRVKVVRVGKPVANQVEQTEESKVDEKIEILEKESRLLRLQIQVEQEKKHLNQLWKENNNVAMKGPSGRVNVSTVQNMCGKFGGIEGQDVTVWLNSVEQTCALLYYDSAEKIKAMMCLLEGGAKWLIDSKKIRSYSEAKEELLKEYRSKATAGII